ncbi:hypothetical protein HK101_010975 [Irineochytrium annulatum]|nr:hypothetical protein HK101_010975 [Irineochytrium annulatum]
MATALDLQLSQLAYGIWRLADGPADSRTPQAINARIRRCLELGITTFDAADIYGGGEGHVCEKLFGDALALSPELRGKMQIVSKCGIACLGVKVKHYNFSREYILRQAKNSIAALQCKFLDVLLIHRPSPLMDPDVVATAFVELKEAGLVKHFGVSNFTSSQMALLQSRLPFALVTNQIEFHPLRLEPLHDGTLDDLLRQKIRPMAWSPLAGGRLFSTSAAAADPAVARVQTKLAAVAKELGADVTVDQVAYAWILQHPSKPVPVIGTNSTERIEVAAKALKLKLSHEQWFGIWEATAGSEVPMLQDLPFELGLQVARHIDPEQLRGLEALSRGLYPLFTGLRDDFNFALANLIEWEGRLRASSSSGLHHALITADNSIGVNNGGSAGLRQQTGRRIRRPRFSSFIFAPLFEPTTTRDPGPGPLLFPVAVSTAELVNGMHAPPGDGDDLQMAPDFDLVYSHLIALRWDRLLNSHRAVLVARFNVTAPVVSLLASWQPRDPCIEPPTTADIDRPWITRVRPPHSPTAAGGHVGAAMMNPATSSITSTLLSDLSNDPRRHRLVGDAVKLAAANREIAWNAWGGFAAHWALLASDMGVLDLALGGTSPVDQDRAKGKGKTARGGGGGGKLELDQKRAEALLVTASKLGCAKGWARVARAYEVATGVEVWRSSAFMELVLIVAAERGHVNLLKGFLGQTGTAEKGCKGEVEEEVPVAVDGAWTRRVMMAAVRSGREDVINNLIVAGKVDVRDAKAALRSAAARGAEGIVRRLIGAGVDPRPVAKIRPLDGAVASGRIEIVRLVLDALRKRDGSAGLNDGFIAEVGVWDDEHSWVPLRAAVKGGDVAIIRLLLEFKEADPMENMAAALLDSPLWWAALEQKTDIVRLFLEGGYVTDADCFLEDPALKGLSEAEFGDALNDVVVVRLLTAAGKRQEQSCAVAFAYACAPGRLRLFHNLLATGLVTKSLAMNSIRLQISEGADASALRELMLASGVDVTSNSLMASAISNGRGDVVRMLMSLGHVQTLISDRAEMIILAAAQNGHVDMMALMIELEPERLRHVPVLQEAASHGQLGIIACVIDFYMEGLARKDPVVSRVDVQARINEALKLGIQRMNVSSVSYQVAKLMLGTGMVTMAGCVEALAQASLKFEADVIRLLLKHLEGMKVGEDL